MTELLSHRINTLLLNARAPFPSEIKEAKDAVRSWRREQRLHLVADRRDDGLRDVGGDLCDLGDTDTE